MTPEQAKLAREFGERLEEARIENEIPSLSELARRVGVDPATGSQWKNGNVGIPMGDTLLRLSDELNRRPQYLAWGQLPKTPGEAFTQAQLRIPTLFDEGALGERSKEGVANLLYSRDIYTQLAIPNPSKCAWLVINDERVEDVFKKGDRLLIDRSVERIAEGWMALTIKGRIVVREVVRTASNKVTFRDGKGETETLPAFEVSCYGAVAVAIRIFERG